jgi:hypothetical protein
MTKNKILLAVFFIVVFIAGVLVIVSRKSVGFGELFGSLSEMNPRVMSLMALPVIAILFVLGAYLRKKNEERKWKKALLKTRTERGSPGNAKH